MTPWQKHLADWKDCQRCGLCQQRDKICLARGKLPADVLLIGEAPGESENVLGQPFVGPAGKELDNWIEAAFGGRFRVAFTNLVACFPKEAKAAKINEPDAAEIKACEPRLRELIWLAKPKLTVCVGTLAAKWVRKLGVCNTIPVPLVDIVHPAYVLRANVAQQGLLAQKAIVTLRQAAHGILSGTLKPEPIAPPEKEYTDADIPF
jgi:uracil-DNA glycosylase family 4